MAKLELSSTPSFRAADRELRAWIIPFFTDVSV